MDEPRLRITARLRAIMSYDKLAGEVPRVVILRSQYWLDGACEAAARKMGWDVASVPAPMEGAASREQIAQLLDAVVTTRPDFVLSINLAGMDVAGMWARFFEDLRIPYVVWFVDNPRTIIMDRRSYASNYAMALTWDEAYAPYLSRVGFPCVHWLPLAADTSIFDNAPGEGPGHPPAFVGNSMVEFADRAWNTVRAQPRLAEIAESAFASGAVNRINMGNSLTAIVGSSIAARLDAEERRHLEMLFFLEGTRKLRHAAVRALAPDGVTVRGDPGWRDVVAAPGTALDYFDELPAFYRNCSVNLNFTSIQMPSAVNQRVFDCPAAGGFLLTDAQPDMKRLFPDGAVASFSSSDECREKMAYYRANAAARRAVIQAAQEHIHREHTYVHRLRTITRWVMEHFG